MTTREDILSLAVPEGWMLVPIKPTDDMLEDADRARALPEHYIRDVYTAMLAAAPTPPAAEAPGQEPVADEIERVARGICLSYGEAPDDYASLCDICGPNNEPLLNWQKYEEQACAAIPAMNRPAPPTYADAEAKGFERGIEAAASLIDEEAAAINRQLCGNHLPSFKEHLRSHLGAYRKFAAAIRSLASPAPKGET